MTDKPFPRYFTDRTKTMVWTMQGETAGKWQSPGCRSLPSSSDLKMLLEYETEITAEQATDILKGAK